VVESLLLGRKQLPPQQRRVLYHFQIEIGLEKVVPETTGELLPQESRLSGLPWSPEEGRVPLGPCGQFVPILSLAILSMAILSRAILCARMVRRHVPSGETTRLKSVLWTRQMRASP